MLLKKLIYKKSGKIIPGKRIRLAVWPSGCFISYNKELEIWEDEQNSSYCSNIEKLDIFLDPTWEEYKQNTPNDDSEFPEERVAETEQYVTEEEMESEIFKIKARKK